MKTYIATAADGTAVHYSDRKRWLWAASVVYPLQPFVGIALHAATGNQAWLLLPLLIGYGVFPLLDWLIGEDTNNPPEAVVHQLDTDHYYRRLTYAVVPLHFAALLGAAWWAGTQSLSWWGYTGLAVVAGMTSGLGINTGHELGHKNSRIGKSRARRAGLRALLHRA
jgi:alkane 1-monooxygenase